MCLNELVREPHRTPGQKNRRHKPAFFLKFFCLLAIRTIKLLRELDGGLLAALRYGGDVVAGREAAQR